MASSLQQRIAEIPDHVGPLPSESASPITHCRRSANDASNLLAYFERNVGRANVYSGPFDRHRAHLRALVLLVIVESFERFVKELAAVCVDQLGPFVADDRLAVLQTQPRSFVAHFNEGSLGRALTESETWLDCDAINRRFRRLLADPFDDGRFMVFPSSRNDPDAWRRGSLEILIQLRHSIVHNVGVITNSDAAKLRILRRAPARSPGLLQLTNSDVVVAKKFVVELAEWVNGRVATRLAEVLTMLHADDTTLFDPAERAAEIAGLLRETVTIAGSMASSP